VRILADAAERTEEIDLARAEEARRRAESEMQSAQDTQARAEAQLALLRAIARIGVAQRHRERAR